MNRRGFLRSLVALLAPILPSVVVAKLVAWKASFGWHRDNENWYCIIHPSQEHDLRVLIARDNWERAYRTYRMYRKVHGTALLDARQIMDGNLVPPVIPHGEVVNYRGFEYIRARRVV